MEGPQACMARGRNAACARMAEQLPLAGQPGAAVQRAQPVTAAQVFVGAVITRTFVTWGNAGKARKKVARKCGERHGEKVEDSVRKSARILARTWRGCTSHARSSQCCCLRHVTQQCRHWLTCSCIMSSVAFMLDAAPVRLSAQQHGKLECVCQHES